MSLADFQIFKLIADYWGCGEMFRRWDSPESVFQLLKQLSAGQPCDFTGIKDYEMLERSGGIQWPFPATPKPIESQERRLFEDGRFYHPDDRSRFVCESPREIPEPPGPKFPFVLLTGRGSAAQWHTQTRTAKSAILRKLYAPELYVEINPIDSRRLGIRSGDPVTVSSQRGSLQGRALVTPAVQPGQLFIPMHYETTNLLTNAVFDPYSHQPAYKACAAAIAPRS
jgi:assimilatory nitrate reductase catalytic subunit